MVFTFANNAPATVPFRKPRVWVKFRRARQNLMALKGWPRWKIRAIDNRVKGIRLGVKTWLMGKILERTQNFETPRKSHRINGPCVFVRAHNPKVVSSNLTPATISMQKTKGIRRSNRKPLLHFGADYGWTMPVFWIRRLSSGRREHRRSKQSRSDRTSPKCDGRSAREQSPVARLQPTVSARTFCEDRGIAFPRTSLFWWPSSRTSWSPQRGDLRHGERSIAVILLISRGSTGSVPGLSESHAAAKSWMYTPTSARDIALTVELLRQSLT